MDGSILHINITHQEKRKTRFLGADDTYSEVVLKVTFSEHEK